MRTLIAAALILAGLSAQAQMASQYKGYESINKLVFRNILSADGTNKKDLAIFIEDFYTPFGGTLINLMGFFPNGVNNGDMSNGDPNSVSYLIHYLVFSEVAKKLKGDCPIIDTPDIVDDYQPSFFQALRVACVTPNNQTIKDGPLEQFWVQMHSFQAPYSEFIAWKNFVNSQSFNSSEDRVYQMMLAAALNPYFIIQN